MNLSSELKIKTAEGIVFSYPLAGPVTRSMAWLLDLLVILVINRSIGLGMQAVETIEPDVIKAATVLGYFLISTGYGIALEWLWRGQTFGKRVFRLRVMDLHGSKLQFHQVLLRNLVRPIDMLPLYLIGGIACLCSRRAQRLGDLAANTVVVRSIRHSEPDVEQLLAGKFNSLREHPHLAARLQQRVSPDEARLALQALVRREQLDLAARVSLFAELAGYFKEIVAFPPEAVESVPDEQYVRDVVDILFRPRVRNELIAKEALELQAP